MQDAFNVKPPQTLLPDLERLLATRPANVAEAIRRVVSDIRPCVITESSRAGTVPLRGSWLDRLRRRPPPNPLLSPTVSKLGGAPYMEGGEQLDDAHRFVGQINFAEAHEALSRASFPIPDGMPHSGLMVVYMTVIGTGKVYWYRTPDDSKAVPTPMECVGKYEARLGFRGSWSLEGLDWYAHVPEHDEELWDYLNNLEIPDVDIDYRHRLFGHTSDALNEHYGLTPVAGRSDSIRDYASIWRIDCDPPAGISWGTNWLYVLIHRDDLASGAFENAIVTGANA